MVDGKSLVGLTHDEAVAVLKATQKLVQLVVATEHIEGESINSSLQSIPEVIASMIAGMKDRQLEGEQQIHHSNIMPDAAIVASKVLQSPPKNAFQIDNFEMEIVTDNSFQRHTGQLETTFQGMNSEIIEIARSEGQPLGFSIRGNTDMSAIFVHTIDPDGPAGRSKLLHEGDQLLKANGVSLENHTQQDALAVLKVRARLCV